MENRWKNPGLYLSLFAILFLVLNDTGHAVDANRFGQYVSYIMAFLGFAGVISNPKEGKFYFDMKNRDSEGK